LTYSLMPGRTCAIRGGQASLTPNGGERSLAKLSHNTILNVGTEIGASP
jgi:hypothetical protein